MAILDKFLEYSDKQVITASAVSTNVVDAGPTKNAAIGRDLGLNGRLYLFINVFTAFAGAGASLTATLQDSADNVTFADVASFPNIPVANLTAGKAFQVGLPVPTRRYTRVNYNVTGGPFTGGAVSAHLIDGPIYAFSYPDLL